MDLCARDSWEVAVAWLDDDRVAISGIGDDEAPMLPGARIFDVSCQGVPPSGMREDLRWAREVAVIAGPTGSFFSDGACLFSSDPNGLSRWDAKRGERIGTLPGFRPTHHHRGARELVQLVDQTLVRLVSPAWSTDGP